MSPPLRIGPLQIGDVSIPGRVLIAPMTGVTDLPFRRQASRLGAAYVATEMVACAELARGRPDMVRRAAVGEGLPLTVIQLVGADPAMIAAGARTAEAAGADIIDLNFGCPAKEVIGAACGSALMRDLDAAERLIGAAVEATSRPVTVKMRLGWDAASRNAADLAARAERIGAAAVSVHGRTRQQFYTGQADWAAVALVRSATRLPLIVNGDITDLQAAQTALRDSGADALMIGRGVYGRPWFAAALDAALAGDAPLAEPEAEARFALVIEHMRQSLAFYGEALGLRIFRKHLGWYIERAPWPVSAEARRAARGALCRLEHPTEVEAGLARLWLEQTPLRRAA
ncbi:MAG: tRNA dihydrouridine synthase DusB [Caulobacteraceae bacterium]